MASVLTRTDTPHGKAGQISATGRIPLYPGIPLPAPVTPLVRVS
jgi:hypothetical protein